MTNSNNDSGNQNDTKTSASNQITEDIENFKSIFSELKNMTESLVCETIENKIIEIAQELAGYQIDKMPEKYEKKIKSFLKNINCFDEKIAIETNDKDYEALSKIENFKNLNKDIKFIPNSEISRGDIILNCDGMYYSEKTINNNQSVKKK
jgi:flagellar biosynthesis/type III secretory pathway protein FliH